jgi:glutathione S-transferase
MPSRACLLLSRVLDLDIEIRRVNIPKLQHYSEEFRKINPLSRIPVLVDGDFVLTESRAILGYLVNTRKPGSPLYPFDAKKRSLIDERLYYDATAVFGSLINVIVSKKTFCLIKF